MDLCTVLDLGAKLLWCYVDAAARVHEHVVIVQGR